MKTKNTENEDVIVLRSEDKKIRKKKKGKNAITKELKGLAEEFNSLLEKYGAFKDFKNDLSIKIDSENTDLSKENEKIYYFCTSLVRSVYGSGCSGNFGPRAALC